MWSRLWRCGVFKQAMSAAAAPPVRERSLLLRPPVHSYSVGAGGGTRPLLLHYPASFFSSHASDGGSDGGAGSAEGKEENGSERDEPRDCEHISCEEAKRLMRLVNLESLKTKLGTESKELISYDHLLETCQAIGVARSPSEAAAFARILDDAGVVLLFRDKVYLHPQKMVDLIRKAVPFALTPDDDPMRDELNMLHKKKEEIDVLAHKQVRRILWCGLCFSIVQISLFFRLTFWEFSWDVMEPIAFFAASTGIVVSYAYFMYTSRDATYQDFMKRLFLSRQKKLFKKLDFDIERYKELQQKRSMPLHDTTSRIKQVRVDMELDDD